MEEADEVHPGRRIRGKTSLWEPPTPSYEDYPPNAWPAVWNGAEAPKPGQPGFNKYAAHCLQGILKFWDEHGHHGDHQPYQQTALASCHPLSPCKRVLVDARMGAGKTKVIISVLDSHFQDGRKKLPIFRTRSLAQNFLDELLRWPNRYRSYFALIRPDYAAKAARLPAGLGAEEQRAELDRVEKDKWDVPAEVAQEVLQRLQVELEMTDIRKENGQKVCAVNRGRLTKTFRQWFQTQFPTKMQLMPGGPLRAMNFGAAGGSFSAQRPSGEPRHPVAQFHYDPCTQNVFDNSIVIIDEVHQLLNYFCTSKVRLLPRQLFTAKSLTLIGALFDGFGH